MKTLKTILEARQGQTISFAYYGGENPGSRRTVLVDEVLDDRIVGTDIAKDAPRQYLVDRAEGIRLVADIPAASAVCDVETPVSVEAAPMTSNPNTRIRTETVPFVDARQRLHNMVDDLTGDDLATMIADIEDADRGKFEAKTGMVVLETEVMVPHCILNLEGDIAGVDWVNEDGETVTLITAISPQDGEANKVVLTLDGETVTAEEALDALAAHLGC